MLAAYEPGLDFLYQHLDLKLTQLSSQLLLFTRGTHSVVSVLKNALNPGQPLIRNDGRCAHGTRDPWTRCRWSC